MSLVEEYKTILARYRNGEFGEVPLSLYEILEKAGRPNLLEEMSISEIEELIDCSFGFTKQMFVNLRNKKSEIQNRIYRN